MLFCLLYFFFSCYGTHRDLHSFPTRRSSDLRDADLAAAGDDSRARADRFPRRNGRPHRHLEQAILPAAAAAGDRARAEDRKSTRLNSSHGYISYAVFCLKKKKSKLELLYELD